jgi:small subunit ribosomal protein S5
VSDTPAEEKAPVAAADEADDEEEVDATKVADPKQAERIARAARFRAKAAPKSGPADEEEGGLTEKVVFINRCAKVVKGGRRFSFSALVVVGDGQGQVGIGFGKANEVAECIRKANEDGRKNMLKVNLEQATIPHEVLGVHGSSKVFMRPASAGTGLIAGGGVRAVAEAAGVKDLLAKSLGSDNPSNVAKAALNGLAKLAHKEDFLAARGKN